MSQVIGIEKSDFGIRAALESQPALEFLEFVASVRRIFPNATITRLRLASVPGFEMVRNDKHRKLLKESA